MTDLVPYQPTDSWVPVLGAVGDLANKLAATPFVPKAMQRNPAAVAAAILTGREMQLGPMASLRGIDVIEGRPSLTAQMLAARIFAAGHQIEWISATDKQCTVRITRGDGLSTAEATWTIGDAQRAGLAGKKVWQQYPRHLLRARALSECAAMACPDVALGIDVADSDGSDRPQQPAQVSTVQLAPVAPVVQEPAEPSYDSTTVSSQTLHASEGENYAETVPETDPETAPQVTRQQLRKLGAQIGELERVEGRKLDRDERRSFIGTLAEVDGLSSANDLTRDQASQAIDRLGDLIRIALDAPVDAEIVEE